MFISLPYFEREKASLFPGLDMKSAVIHRLLQCVGQEAPSTLRPTWRTGVRSGMHAASQLSSGEGAWALIWMILWHQHDNDEDVYYENTTEMVRS